MENKLVKTSAQIITLSTLISILLISLPVSILSVSFWFISCSAFHGLDGPHVFVQPIDFPI
jgi:ABC-type transport system involved in cytochrome bd biosynthesis fused ATPase/permease subunit